MTYIAFIIRTMLFSVIIWGLLYILFGAREMVSVLKTLNMLSAYLTINHLLIFRISNSSMKSKKGTGLMAGMFFSFFSKFIIGILVLGVIRWTYPYADIHFVGAGVCVIIAHLVYQVYYLDKLNNQI